MYNLTSDVGCPSFEQVLEDVKVGKKSMILVSGGLDSAYILWKYAQYNEDIVCHHIALNKSISKRVKSERISVERQIKYLEERGKKIKLLTSEVSFSDDKPPIRDWYSAVMLSLNYVLREKVSHIVVGDDLPDSYDRAQEYSTLPAQYANEIAALNHFVKTYTYNKCDICTALDANNLSEKYFEMPEDYRKLIFSCRKPVYINNPNSIRICEACGNCESCTKNLNFGWFNKIATAILKDKVYGTSI